MLAAEHDDSELVGDSLRYAEPVQFGVQQPRQTPVELVGKRKDEGSSVEHSLNLVSRDLWSGLKVGPGRRGRRSGTL